MTLRNRWRNIERYQGDGLLTLHLFMRLPIMTSALNVASFGQLLQSANSHLNKHPRMPVLTVDFIE